MFRRNLLLFTFIFKWVIPGLFFLYFRLFNTVDCKQMFDKSLPMTGIEPRFPGTQPLPMHQFFVKFRIEKKLD